MSASCGEELFLKSPPGYAGRAGDLTTCEVFDDGMLLSSTLFGAAATGDCFEPNFIEDRDGNPEGFDRAGAVTAAAGFWGGASVPAG